MQCMYVHTHVIAFYIRVCLTIILSTKLGVYMKHFMIDYELIIYNYSFDYNITNINDCVLPQSY